MAIIRWKPTDDVDRLRQEVDHLFGNFLSGTEPFFSRVYPAVNISERDNNFYVRAELPGVKPGSLDISVVEGRLQIRGRGKSISRNRRRAIIAGSGKPDSLEGPLPCL